MLFLLLIAIYSYLLKKRTNQQLLIKNAEIGNQSEEINLQNEMLIERNEKITEQKEKIEKLNKSKDKIFSIIGHDLRNVVGTTASSLSFLADRKSTLEGENTQLLLNELRDNAKRTFNLLENLLSWGKSQMSGIIIEPVQFEVTDSINETIGFLSTMAQKKNITIHTKFEDETLVLPILNR
ncbi:MAG: HAMP domain-containing histidine kinase [Chloroflexia bacterium]|nr:HAMP domain-containing histidine kinase [Chloroflexia bacterium]